MKMALYDPFKHFSCSVNSKLICSGRVVLQSHGTSSSQKMTSLMF